MLEKLKEQWETILHRLKEEYDVTEPSYNTWLLPLKPYAVEKNVVKILVPDSNPHYIAIIRKRYEKQLQVTIEEVTGFSCTIQLISENDIREKKTSEKYLIRSAGAEVNSSALQDANLNPRYTFETFVIGSNNEMAHAASLAVAESPGMIYNPLFIYGGVGLGKTHLMQSIAHFILRNNPKAKVLYVTSEKFTNELIDAIRNKINITTSEFHEKYRNIDVLLIDDIQFIVGKESTQEEFFHTFNTLYEAKKQIIISSDKPPKDFKTLEERLRSRFEWGLTVDIQPPGYETRMAILRKKEDMDGYNIDNEVIKYIAANVKSNIRELEGALTKIVALSKLEKNKEIDIALAEEALKDIISPDEENRITSEKIIKVVADHFGITPLDISSQKRTREIAYPRQIAMYLCQNMTDDSLQVIGSYLGGRDHTTIIHGRDKIAREMKTDASLANTINVLKKKLTT